MDSNNRWLTYLKTFFFLFLVVNLLLLDGWMLWKKGNWEMRSENKGNEKDGFLENPFFERETAVSPVPLPQVYQDSCGESCQQKINQEVANQLTLALATISGQKTTEKVVFKEPSTSTPKTSNQANVAYIPLVTSGSTVLTDWTDVSPSDFYFDLTSYPGAKSVRFSGYLRAVNPTGPVYVRLYDVTNKRAVDYGDFSTQSNTAERFESSPLSIWRGNNLYRLQLRSSNGTEARLSEAKLKVEW